MCDPEWPVPAVRAQQRACNLIKTYQLICQNLLDHAQIPPNLDERETFQVFNGLPTYRQLLIESESSLLNIGNLSFY